MQIVKAVRIRMYRQGLGDCFLCSFAEDLSFADAAHVLIDCGTIGATTTGVTLTDVVRNIASTAESGISALVATHEHLDHVSGFRSQRNAFDDIGVANVWVAWTENPEDLLAQKLKKYSADLKLAALSATQALAQLKDTDAEAQALAHGTNGVLSFFGDPGLGAKFAESVDEAMKYVASRAPDQTPEYLSPGTFVQPSWLPGVTVFVLGPPRDDAKIRNMGEHGDPELYELSSRSLHGLSAVLKGFAPPGRPSYPPDSLDAKEQDLLELSLPFDRRFRCPVKEDERNCSSYYDKANSWRRIDSEWLSTSADLALQLDNLTNNTSLVLAFEIGADGPVILMAADAQLGSWLSWHEYTWRVPSPDGSVREIKACDLLNRTLIYKVGHHSSHNATAVEHGLEMMTNRSLLALVPLDGKVAASKKWPMPAKKLYDTLLEKTRGRTLRSDIGWPEEDRPESISASAWKKLPTNIQVVEERDFIDVLLVT